MVTVFLQPISIYIYMYIYICNIYIYCFWAIFWGLIFLLKAWFQDSHQQVCVHRKRPGSHEGFLLRPGASFGRGGHDGSDEATEARGAHLGSVLLREGSV